MESVRTYSEKQEMTWTFAKSIAEEVLTYLKIYGIAEIAGSIRRKETIVRDIDIIMIPNPNSDIFLPEYVSRFAKVIRHGDDQIMFTYRGVQVNVYYTTHESWGAMLMYATGPAGSNMGMRQKAQLVGKRKTGSPWKLNQDGLWNEKGELIAGKTEAEIASALDYQLKSPEMRGGKWKRNRGL